MTGRSAARSYRIVLPPPWERIPVRQGVKEKVGEIVDRAVTGLPKEAPPDQYLPHRRRLEEQLLAQLREADEYGGVDVYVPTDTWHGLPLSASFVVSEVVPDNAVSGDEAVGGVLAHLVSSRPGAAPITVGDTTWVRSEHVADADAERTLGQQVASRRVDYLTAVPGDERRWVLVAFSCAGDGDPDGEYAHLLVELFDAIMSTWRWVRAGQMAGS